MKSVVFILLLIAGSLVGDAIKDSITSVEFWKDLSCTQLAEVPDSWYPIEAKSKALEVYNAKCTNK